MERIEQEGTGSFSQDRGESGCGRNAMNDTVMSKLAAKVLRNAKDRDKRFLTKAEVVQIRNTHGSLKGLAIKFGKDREYLDGIRRGTFRNF